MTKETQKRSRALPRLPWGLGLALVALAVSAGVALAGSSRSAAAPTIVNGPTITGTAQEGKLLVASHGTWTGSPADWDYQWVRCGKTGTGCARILDATSKEYVAVSADIGNTLRVRVTAKNADGTGVATSAPTAVVKAAPSNAPQLSASPTITGTPQQGQTLTASNGSWAGAQPFTFTYTWLRCDVNGDGCVEIAGATTKTYALQSADVGKTVRVRVTAKNASGSAAATTVPTAVVRKASAAAGSAISVSEVSLPARLVVDRFEYSPNPVRSLSDTLTIRFRVSDTEDHRVQGALVFVLGLPYGRFTVPAETATGSDGWVQFQVQPTRRLLAQLHRGGKFNFFVRARKPGENPLAGVSTRRLVQVNLSSPA